MKENEFLLELGFEELPADYLKPASAQLMEDVKNLLAEKGINHSRIEQHYTVRRFVLFIGGMDEKQKDISSEKKGPRHYIAYKDSALTDIGRTFLQKNGKSENDIKIKEAREGRTGDA